MTEERTGTAGAVVAGLPDIDRPTAYAVASKYGVLRTTVNSLRSEIDEGHHQAQNYDLEDRAAIKARSGVPTLLAELAVDRGLAWSDLARLVGVSVGAVRKWRTDGGTSPESRLHLARLAAFLDLLEESAIEDPAQWMEMRISLSEDGYPITPMDIYRSGHQNALLDYASARTTADEMMNEVDPQWRERRSDFEVFVADDGDRAIRPRARS